MTEILIELKDSYIQSIETDKNNYGGCDTCDYGSSYINELNFRFKEEQLTVEVNEMYDYALSEGFLMTLMLNGAERIKQMTEKEFVRWFCTSVKNHVGSADVSVNYTKEIDLLETLEEWGK